MSVYLDANFLVRLYLPMRSSAEAQALLQAADVRPAWPLPVTDLLRFEVTNAFQRMVFEGRSGGQLRISTEAAGAAQANFDDDLKLGQFLKHAPLTLPDIWPQFDSLVGRHTAKHGFRTYDLMHVSSALHLGCTRFLSFDKNAISLAKLEGLQTN